MIKTIIAVYGRQNEGKSSTIKSTFSKLINDYVNYSIFPPLSQIYLTTDIYVVVTINNIRIGFESQGDPNSRIITQNTLEKLAANPSSSHFDPNYSNCDIIVCASRTSGATVTEVDRVANSFNYRTLWKSSYYAPNFNYEVINRIASEEIVSIIQSIITTEL